MTKFAEDRPRCDLDGGNFKSTARLRFKLDISRGNVNSDNIFGANGQGSDAR
jgi:hypothetical protein